MRILKYPSCICAFLVLISSCKQETEPNPPAKILLSKTVEKVNSDSVVTEYTYDNADRLIAIHESGMMGVDRTRSFVISRDANGKVTQFVEKSAQLASAGCDSFLNKFVYSSSADRYLHQIMTADYNGSLVYDSITFGYDAQGRIIRENHFQTLTGVPWLIKYFVDFVYTPGGDIDSVKSSEEDPPPVNYTISSVYSLDYDQQINPLKLGNEAILIYQYYLGGTHNSTGTKFEYINTTQTPYMTSSVHTYNQDGHPAVTVTSKPAGVISTTIWYYK